MAEETYNSRQRIPKDFVKKYGEILCEEAIIELVSDDESGKTWNVKIKPIDDCFWFTNGWSEFVKDKQLAEMDFLVFKLIGESTFQVGVYGKEGVLKDPSSSSPCSRNLIRSPPRCEGKYDQREVKTTTSFTIHFKNRRQYGMVIPRAFAVSTGIARANAVNLQNAKGEKWRVELTTPKDGRIRMGRGWKAFVDANRLSGGSDTCTFEFDPNSGNLIMIKEGTSVS